MTYHINEERRRIFYSGGVLLCLLASAISLENNEHTTESTSPKHENVNHALNESAVLSLSDSLSPLILKNRSSTVFPMNNNANKNAKREYHGSTNVSSKRDSYLEALEYSRGNSKKDARKISKLSRREYISGPVYLPESSTRHDYSNEYSSWSNYEAPQNSYGTASSMYGVPPSYPHQSYGPPSASYLPHQQASGSSNYGPSPSYGGGNYAPSYGPPRGSEMDDASYGAPYALSHGVPMLDFSWPFALKLDLFTLSKILLKLVLFKMIVKFIAVICLLLFIPKLEIIKKKGEKGDANEEEEGRALFTPGMSLEGLNILTSTVINSVEKYRALNESRSHAIKEENCETFDCRVSRALRYKETWNDYAQLVRNYLSEESETVK